MTVLCGLNHIGVLTDDLDRMLAFYQTTFGAPVVRDATDDGVRNALIDVGGGLLNVFQAGGHAPHPDRPSFQSGRLNHFALSVPTREAFFEIRRRLVDAGRSDGLVRDFGSAWSLKYRDPDEFVCELIWTVDSHGRLSTPPRILADQDELAAAGLEALREPPDLAASSVGSQDVPG
jgi:catechol 2,3-dioxygenase-like lactoylglutathione lyase family enzyme